jgi:hypothetical protein
MMATWVSIQGGVPYGASKVGVQQNLFTTNNNSTLHYTTFHTAFRQTNTNHQYIMMAKSISMQGRLPYGASKVGGQHQQFRHRAVPATACIEHLSQLQSVCICKLYARLLNALPAGCRCGHWGGVAVRAL